MCQEAYKCMEDRNTRLCDKLKEVIRTMALQEARQKREVVADDCVRLGKIITARLVCRVQLYVWCWLSDLT